jgi:hypothetical protein
MYTKNYEILNFISIGVKRGGSIVEFRPLTLSTLYEYGNIFEFIFFFVYAFVMIYTKYLIKQFCYFEAFLK